MPIQRNVSLVYDPTTGTWVTTPSKDPIPPEDIDKVEEYSPTSDVDSPSAAKKEQEEIEFNTLTGELTMTTTKKTVRMQVNDTVKLVGFGKYLSGLYFVSSILRNLNLNDGYHQTATLIRIDFGESLKGTPTQQTTRLAEVQKNPTTLSVGDSVRIVGDDAVYSNAHDGVKVPNWVKKEVLTVDAISSDGTRVRLNPIWSWTYVKYVQKV